MAKKKEYDVHFNLHGFFRKIEATSPKKAKEIAEKWLTAALPSLEAAVRVGLGWEITDSISDEDRFEALKEAAVRVGIERALKDRFEAWLREP